MLASSAANSPLALVEAKGSEYVPEEDVLLARNALGDAGREMQRGGLVLKETRQFRDALRDAMAETLESKEGKFGTSHQRKAKLLQRVSDIRDSLSAIRLLEEQIRKRRLQMAKEAGELRAYLNAREGFDKRKQKRAAKKKARRRAAATVITDAEIDAMSLEGETKEPPQPPQQQRRKHKRGERERMAAAAAAAATAQAPGSRPGGGVPLLVGAPAASAAVTASPSSQSSETVSSGFSD